MIKLIIGSWTARRGKQTGKSDLSILQIITEVGFQAKLVKSHHQSIYLFQQKSQCSTSCVNKQNDSRKVLTNHTES